MKLHVELYVRTNKVHEEKQNERHEKFKSLLEENNHQILIIISKMMNNILLLLVVHDGPSSYDDVI